MSAQSPNGVVHRHSGTVREVLTLSAPLIVSYISFSLMGMVDTLIIGRVGTPEQGGIGLGGMLSWLFGVVFVGTITVINTLVAQDYGAGRHDHLRRHVHAGLVLIPFFTMLIWLAIRWLPDILRVMGTAAEVAPWAEIYIRIRIYAAPLALINFALVSFLRGLGNMRTPMVVTLIANLINGIVSVIMVFGYCGFPRMGVAGAAWGSVFAATCETGMYLIIYLNKENHSSYRTRSWVTPSWREFRHFLKIGLPIGFLMLFDMLAWTIFTIYSSTLGATPLAAHVIVFQIMHLSFLPTAAISIAGTTLVGQYLGAKRSDLAERSAIQTILVGVGYMVWAGAMMAVFRTGLIRIFNTDPAVVALGPQLMLFAALFQPFDGMGMTIAGVLRGAGDTRQPMAAIFLCGCFLFVPGVFILGEAFDLGIIGAWIAADIHVFVFAMILLARYRKGRWKRIKLEEPTYLIDKGSQKPAEQGQAEEL